MLNPTALVKAGTQFLSDNAPVILTSLGAVGVVATAVLTAKASFEASEKIREAQIEKNLEELVNTPLTKTEKVKLVWPLYVGAVLTGAASCGAIVMSHRISSKRAAVLAAAYALNKDKLEEYQDKVKEKLGLKKEKEVRDEIAQEKVTRSADAGFEYASPIAGKVWLMEAYTGRPFMGTVEGVKRSVNEINSRINSPEGYAHMSDFYDLIGLDHVTVSDHFGWTRVTPLDLDWSTTTSPDGSIAVHVFEYTKNPVDDPEREAFPFR